MVANNFICTGPSISAFYIGSGSITFWGWFWTNTSIIPMIFIAAFLHSFSDLLFGSCEGKKTVTLHMIGAVISQQQWQNWHGHPIRFLLRELLKQLYYYHFKNKKRKKQNQLPPSPHSGTSFFSCFCILALLNIGAHITDFANTSTFFNDLHDRCYFTK